MEPYIDIERELNYAPNMKYLLKYAVVFFYFIQLALEAYCYAVFA